MAIIYSSISGQYETAHRTSEATEYIKKALTIHEAIGDREALANDFFKLGQLYSSDEKLDTAIDNYNKALALKERLQDKYGLASIYDDLGRVYERKNETKTAKQMYQKRDKISSENIR